MTIAQIVLASLNILVAIAMFYLAGQSAYARAAWIAQVRGLEKLRDGSPTGEWLKELPAPQQQALQGRIFVDESTFLGMDPAVRQELLGKLRAVGEAPHHRARSDEGIRSEIASLFWSTGQRVQVAKDGDNRKFTVVNDEAAQKNTPPDKLFLDDPEVAVWAKKLGPAGMNKLIRAALQQQYPQLAMQVREAAAKVYFSRIRLAEAILDRDKLKEEVTELGKRRDVEKELLRQAEFENLERRREITRLEADVEEAMSALTLSLGREADKLRLAEEVKQKSKKAIDDSEKLVSDIKNKEGQ
jgi:hypothetical protein